MTLRLPTTHGTLETYVPGKEPLQPRAPVVPFTRTAFAAAHVVSDPMAERDPWVGRPAIDWDATIGFRQMLWDQGLGLAEAMDTAQRGMGVDWLTAKELIERTMDAARAHSLAPRVACGAGTDQLDPGTLPDEGMVVAAYSEQMEAIEAAGGQCIIMASRAMPRAVSGPDGYLRVYDRLISGARGPVILHWLGDMFDPALKGYWGHDDLDSAEAVVLSIMEHHAGKIDGIKISLLDQAREEAFRVRLPAGVKLYTGDDFNYAPLIAGDGQAHSHALLGIFAAISPAAAQALEALAVGDRQTYDALLEPTVPLSREIFRAPTQFYKAGIAFLSWLNGYQGHFVMPAGFQSSRDITHYAEVFRLADKARLLIEPDLATRRMTSFLAVHGLE